MPFYCTLKNKMFKNLFALKKTFYNTLSWSMSVWPNKVLAAWHFFTNVCLHCAFLWKKMIKFNNHSIQIFSSAFLMRVQPPQNTATVGGLSSSLPLLNVSAEKVCTRGEVLRIRQIKTDSLPFCPLCTSACLIFLLQHATSTNQYEFNF